MRRGVVFIVGVVLATLVGTAGMVAWSMSPRPKPEPVQVDFDSLSSEYPAIRIQGTAHYRGVVLQTVPAGLLTPPQKYYVYALFPPFDTEGREISLLVRSTVPPTPRVDYEFMELEGWLDRPRPVTIPFRTEEMLAKADYFFGDDVLVLEPWSQRTVDPSELTGE